MALGGLGRVWPGVALIDIGHLDRASGDLLHVLGQRLDLGAIALIGRGHRQREQVAQRVDGDVDLGALAPFRAIVACPRAALGCGLQRAAVDTRCRRLALASGKLVQQNARVFDQPLEASRPHPALHLLKNCRPGRIVVRHEPPLVACPRNVANAVENSTQIVLPMGAVLAAQQQIRQHKRPFLVRHIARIAKSSLISPNRA